MKPRRLLALLLVGLGGVSGCDRSATPAPPPVGLFEPREAQPKLATLQLWLGPEQMTAELAVRPGEIMTGMMFRTNMAENEGMIFVLGAPQRASFWMKNCSVPLSVAYMDEDGVILEIHDLEPHNTNTVSSAADNVRFALETPQGWFKRHNINQGVTVRSERGSLMDTFNQAR
jgi:uncharacterized protein